MKNIYILIAAMLFVSCDLIIVKKEEKDVLRESIINDKIEASLLSKATQKNLNIIELCNQVEDTNLNSEIITVAKKIKKEQLEILENLQNIAKENMILVANSTKIKPLKNDLSREENIKKILIHQIKENLDIQKEVLDSLLEKSNNKDITLVAEESIQKLKGNIDTTFNTLKLLK